MQGIAALNRKGQPGPYALILETSVYADAFSPVGDALVTTADRLTPLLAGGFYSSGAMPEHSGLLVSLGGDPTTIYITTWKVMSQISDALKNSCFEINGLRKCP